MNVMIQPVNTAAGRGWQVRLGKQTVTFRSEPEAREFVSTLQARLNAPHVLPAEQQRVAS
ncbi:hypothetical protein [Pseudomonas spirodelae]|uniref:Uncharacterized protein n=1 Tax=Pseudomonas spirodelae TaxID=3101751 RepID=A0ABU5PDW2_9PSED|nr:hypothetical protein [Pseudomonas sp. T5W1]MBU0808046.1 hypothetical protein [Gammaproteobacteria bacterium]MBU0901045.1 hypothetical protein [Gammaproteobacteria bacterium]MBU1860141.1 hypothetical protein [Gammaproteobacteria bacterium]MEA1607876.1 hypothetical protein [Pseudomonas sp. T5W1]